METKSRGVGRIIATIMGIALVAVAGMFLPSWGKLELKPSRTVTVVGEAKSEEKTQIAVFSAGVNAYNDDKNAAVTEVNKKVEAIIDGVRTFGVSAEDIKTQSLNIYQNQESYYEDGRQKLRPGQWNVGNTVEIKLRNVDQAAELATVLTKSGATNVYGPNFSFDDTDEQATALFDDAMKNAADKATKVAAAAGTKLGKIISVTEAGSSQQPITYFAREAGGGGGGGAISPGTGTVTKTVTVTFELE